MSDVEEHERVNNEPQEFSGDEDDVHLESEEEGFALLRLVQTTAGQDLYVNSIAQSALGMGNWGGLLGAAPDALGRLGQCFILASDPLAATLTIPEKAGLPYKSLRANLVECSDRGRKAFRDAETKMKKVSTLAQAVCEPGGTIDMILEAVEDEDLAELDLPDQLATLKRISTSCIKDTQELKAKVDNWGAFAKSIHTACVDQDEELGSKKKGLGAQIEVKELSVKMKHAAVDESKQQTAEYRRQLAARQVSHNKAEKANARGGWVDFGHSVGETVLSGVKSFINPLSALGGLSLSFGGQGQTEQHYAPDPHARHEEQDAGFVLAQDLLPIIHRLAELLTYGPDEFAGVDWESLNGRADRSNDINCIVSILRDVHNRFVQQQSGTIRQIRTASKPGEETALEIQSLVRTERELGSNIHRTMAERAPVWRKQVTSAESEIADRIATVLETAKQAEAKRQEAKDSKRRTTKMSRAEIRFEQFRMAQQALFDAEGRLNKRLEEDLKMTEEFNAMQIELQRLLSSEATMAQVKEIVGECVSHLHYFCEKLDDLASFFTMLQRYIEEMDSSRVDPFSTMANTTKQLSDRAKVETSEDKRKRQDKIKQKKLEDLRFRALELKGYYLVAKSMADTYTEVSAGYIIPGVNQIERLSLPEAKNMTKEERAAKISEVGHLAQTAKDEVKRIANKRKKEMIRAMTNNQGEIEELKAIEDS